MVQSWILYCLGIIWFWKTMRFKLVQERRIHYKVVGDSPNNKDWDIQLVDLICANSWLPPKGDGFNMISWDAFWGGGSKQGNIPTSKFCDLYNRETFQHENCINIYSANKRCLWEAQLAKNMWLWEQVPYVSAAEILTLVIDTPSHMTPMTF